MPKRININPDEEWTSDDNIKFNELRRKYYRCKVEFREKLKEKSKNYVKKHYIPKKKKINNEEVYIDETYKQIS